MLVLNVIFVIKCPNSIIIICKIIFLFQVNTCFNSRELIHSLTVGRVTLLCCMNKEKVCFMCCMFKEKVFTNRKYA